MDNKLYEHNIEFLKVESPVTEESIKKAFRNFCKKYHPDVYKNENADEIFKRGKIAFDYLLEHVQEYIPQPKNSDTKQKNKNRNMYTHNTKKTKKKTQTDNRAIFNEIFNIQEIWWAT